MKLFGTGNFLLRSYAVIVLGIVLIALLLDSLMAARSRESLEEELRVTHAPLFALLEDTLLALPDSERSATLQQLSNDWPYGAQLLHSADFAGDPELAEELASGQLLVFADSRAATMLYQRLGPSDDILALGPLPQAAQGLWFETLVITAYYTLVALLVLWWIRPFYRDLTLLRRAAADFGKADFSTRVQLSAKSSILPVAQSFNAMAERIEYLVEAHKELTHAVSHELRTPLARFRFSLEILARNSDEEKKQYYLENMKADVAELETLIDELLSYARLSEENLLTNELELDLRSWMQELLAAYADQSIAVNCSYGASSPGRALRARFDPDLMARAVHNIIRNGLRYARHSINLHVHVGDERVEIRICDDGPGIPDAMQERIFEPFARLETSRDKSSGGYGLGLAIAARILQRHRGSIHVENCAPCGACFILRWPGTLATA
jgi:signal transduction histidine kinase